MVTFWTVAAAAATWVVLSFPLALLVGRVLAHVSPAAGLREPGAR